MSTDFALPQIIRALGRGKKGTRDLEFDEAYQVMMAILNGRISSAQLGAFLMLMRVKEETAEEIAGMAAAAEQWLGFTSDLVIDINWPAYAGKKKQASWYLLAAKVLAQNGYKIFIHGGGEHTPGRQYAQQVCQRFGIACATSLQEAEQKLTEQSICYVALQYFYPVLADIIDMKAELGLRSPVNTLVRHLAPFASKLTLQAMFHPAYMPIHHDAAKRLQQHNNLVLKGDGGEFEVRPDSACKVASHHQSQSAIYDLAPVLSSRVIRPPSVAMTPLLDTWTGTQPSVYGVAAVTQTMALILSQLHSQPLAQMQKHAEQLWVNRDSTLL